MRTSRGVRFANKFAPTLGRSAISAFQILFLPRLARARGNPTALSPRLKIIVILTSWFLATGSQWDFAQAFGWSRMFVRYAETMSVTAAVERTFSGETCEICRAVRRAKDSEQQGTPTTDVARAKVVLFCPATPGFVMTAPVPSVWSQCDVEPLSAARAAPPVPPPRIA
jgi:hypothetical protein